MMQGSDFLFCLQNASNGFWQPDNNGLATVNNNPYFLKFAPDGHSDIEIKNIRNKKYWGIDRTVSLPLTYINDGALILKDIFYKLGIEETVYLVICQQKLDYTAGVNYGYWYKQIYRGEVYLSTFMHTDAKVTCTTLEGGIPKHLKANENTVYEFPFTDPAAIYLKEDGINLHEKLNYQDTSATHIPLLRWGTVFINPTNFLNNEGDHVGLLESGQDLQDISGLSFAARMALTNCILTNTGTSVISLTIAGRVEFVCTGMVSLPAYAFRLQFATSNMTIPDYNTSFHVVNTAAMVVGQTYTIDYSITVPLAVGERLFCIGTYFGGPGSNAEITYTANSKMSISFLSILTPTYIKAFRGQYLFEQLINKITEGEFTSELSSYLATHYDKVFTCGNAIRGFSDAVLKISFADFWQFWDCFDSVALTTKTLGKTVNISTKVNAVDKVNIIDLPEPSNLKISVSKDYLYNEVEIGYPDIKNDVGMLNGKEEFNTGYLFSVGTTKSPAKISKISTIQASCYEIEKIRITTVAKDTTDNKNDNNVYVLHIEDALQPAGLAPAHYRLDRSLNSGATGLTENATVFNIALSPKRMLFNNGPFLRSSLYLADMKILAYKSSDRNSALSAAGITENADVQILDLGDKFFYPVLFDFEVPAPDNLLELLDANPLQVFRFPFYGINYTGIAVNVSVAPSSRKAQTYRLLSTSENDLTQLIKYFGG